MKSMKLMQAIKNLAPNAQFSINADDLDTMVWIDSSIVQPSKEAILTEYERIKDLPDPELSIEEKLSNIGVTVNDLKNALGL